MECLKQVEEELKYQRRVAIDTWISGFVLLGISLMLSLILRFKHVWEIYVSWVCPHLCKNQATSRHTFDAFIAYDHRDQDVRTWIETRLVPRLEKSASGPKIKLFLMERDSRPGCCFLDVVHEVIQHANCTLVIISKNFVNHPWLCHALRDAEYSSLLTTQHRAKIALFDISVDDAQRQDELVCEYIEREEFLLVSSWNFWIKLLHFLPYRPNRVAGQHRDGKDIELRNLERYILHHE